MKNTAQITVELVTVGGGASFSAPRPRSATLVGTPSTAVTTSVAGLTA